MQAGFFPFTPLVVIHGLVMLELSSVRRWRAVPDPRIHLLQGSSFAPLKIHGLVGPPRPHNSADSRKRTKGAPSRSSFHFFFFSKKKRAWLDLLFWLLTWDFGSLTPYPCGDSETLSAGYMCEIVSVINCFAGYSCVYVAVLLPVWQYSIVLNSPVSCKSFSL